MALQKCHECGKKVSTEAERCPNCGAPVILKKKEGWQPGCFGYIAIIFLGLLFVGFIGSLMNPSTEKKNVPNVKAELSNSFKKMTSAEHMAEAKKALAAGYKPNKDPMKTKWGRVADAKLHINAIKNADKEFQESQDIRKEIDKREKEIRKVSLVVAKKMMIQQRENFSKKMEQIFLEHGFDVHVKISGKEKETITMTYVLWSRPLIYKFMNDSNFYDTLKKAGFKRAVFDDKYYHTWTYKIN